MGEIAAPGGKGTGGFLAALKKCFCGNSRTAAKPDLSLIAGRIRSAEPFRNLPDGNIARMLERIEIINVSAGAEIVSEGQEGEHFFIVADGVANVLRTDGSKCRKIVAELKEGDGFGEEALISCGKRNATVCMKTDGILLRLSKSDFNECVREPMLTWLGRVEACRNVEAGGRWLDVREDASDSASRLRGALCIPLSRLRGSLTDLDRNVFYVCCCQNGRLSATAAFLLVQRGYKAAVLRGGLQGLSRS